MSRSTSNHFHRKHTTTCALDFCNFFYLLSPIPRAISAMARTTTTNSDYGAPTVSANKTSRLLLTATHALHLISSLIVLGIAAYFIANFGHNTHILFWICVVRLPTQPITLHMLTRPRPPSTHSSTSPPSPSPSSNPTKAISPRLPGSSHTSGSRRSFSRRRTTTTMVGARSTRPLLSTSAA